MTQLSQEDQRRISWIKDNLRTQDKWLKGDYIEFYNRDINNLLEIIEKVKKKKRRGMKRIVVEMKFEADDFTHFLKDLLCVPNEWRSDTMTTQVRIKIKADKSVVQNIIYEWLKQRIEK